MLPRPGGSRRWSREHSLQYPGDHQATSPVRAGTGGFANAYRHQVAGTGKFPVDSPHNESLLMTAQLGIFGLVAPWFFYRQQWRQSRRLSDPSSRHLAQALLISFMLGGLMNSLLINHAESLFIAWMTAWLYARLEQPPLNVQKAAQSHAPATLCGGTVGDARSQVFFRPRFLPRHATWGGPIKTHGRPLYALPVPDPNKIAN